MLGPIEFGEPIRGDTDTGACVGVGVCCGGIAGTLLIRGEFERALTATCEE